MLTAIFLTDRNDQIFLNALKSVVFADQILIFDYQSENDWTKLKKHFPQLKIVKKTGIISDFAAVRNEAIELVKTDWLLFLDSDEILEKGAEDKIKDLVVSNVDAFTLKRIDFFHDEKVNWGEVKNVNLICLAKTKKIKFNRKVHEKSETKGTINKSGLRIWHYPHHNIDSFLNSVNNYAQLEANYRKENDWTYSKAKLLLELLLYPPLKFIWNYFFKLGFWDGFAGFVYAVLMSFHSLLVRIYLYEK